MNAFFPSSEMEYVGRYSSSLESQGSLDASYSKVRQGTQEGLGLEAAGKGLTCCYYGLLHPQGSVVQCMWLLLRLTTRALPFCIWSRQGSYL